MPTRKEDENLHNEESVRADARLVRDGLEAIQNILNPLDLALAEKNAVQETKAASLLRDKFTTCKYVYETIQPDEEKCPQTLRHVAEEEFGQKLSTDLELYIAIPKYLLESEGSNASYPIKLAIRFHGGGGVSGPVFPRVSANVCRRLENRCMTHSHISLTSSTRSRPQA
jgi:hypothetical protein